MSYYRQRNSRYATYARNSHGQANFIDPSLLLDPTTYQNAWQGLQGGVGDALNNIGTDAGYYLAKGRGMAEGIGAQGVQAAQNLAGAVGTKLGTLGGQVGDVAQQVGTQAGTIGGRVMDAFGNLSTGGKAAVASAGGLGAVGAGLAGRDAVRGIRASRKAAQVADPTLLQRMQSGVQGLASNPMARKAGIGAAGAGTLAAIGLGGKYLYDQMNASMYTGSIADMCSNPQNAAYFSQVRRVRSRRLG